MIILETRGQNDTVFRRGEITEIPFYHGCEKTVYISENIWDCIGDIMMHLLIEEKFAGSENSGDDIYLKGMLVYEPKHYNAESLLLTYMELKKKGWKIHMKSENVFRLECPDFDEAAQSLLTIAVNPVPSVMRKEYAHPVDSGVIKALDMPGLKMVLGSVMEILTDLNYSEIISSGIPVNAKSFPEIDEIVNYCVSVLGIRRPYLVVSNSIAMQTFTVGSDEEPYIVLGNMLIRAMDKEKLAFIIGHECGHIAMGHVIYHTVVSAAGTYANTIPLIGPLVYKSTYLALSAWSRRSEITADRAGLLCCGNIEQAKRALLQTQSGFINSDKLDIKNYVKNSKRYRRGSTLRRIGEFTQVHPPLAKRMEALDLFANSEVYYRTQGKTAPANCLCERDLTSSVEHIIAVLGEE